MEITEIRPGMHVRVDPISIDTTHRRHNSCEPMHKMKGKVYMVEEVMLSKNRIRFNGYVWAPEDLQEPEVKKIEPQIFHFDTKHL